MFDAVAAASPDTTCLPPATMPNAPVRIVINQKKPAALAFKRGDASAHRSLTTGVLMGLPFCARRWMWRARTSDRLPITAQAHRGREEGGGDRQPDPQTRRDQER